MAARRERCVNLGCAIVVPFAPLFWKHPEVFGSYYAFSPAHQTADQAEDIRRAFHLSGGGPVPAPSSYGRSVAAAWATSACCPLPPGTRSTFQMTWSTFAPASCSLIVVPMTATPSGHSCPVGRRRAAGSWPSSRTRAHTGSSRHGWVRSRLRSGVVSRSTKRRSVLRHRRWHSSPTSTEASSTGSGALTVDCVTLDDTLAGRKPTYVKMDIEGFEPEALAGGRGLIASSLPVLAICVYHEYDHPWRIPLAIASMTDGYRYYLRPHHLQAWDLGCYAVPFGRVKD